MMLPFPIAEPETSAIEAGRKLFAGQTDFLKGDVENLSIDGRGQLLLGPALDLVYETPAPFVWTILAAPDGSFFLGTGNDGKVYRVGADGRAQIERYFEFRTSGQAVSDRSLDDLADELESILVPTVERRLLSDVPLGAFLSGGVDSSLICAVATRRLGRTLRTWSPTGFGIG